ncbi:Eco57I restriction-modification methylase domain-containing protein [Erysipelothrix rhusiopathiae]|nr:Eco57I restriction-modification methylase domain-containing protein [Erysipelothrix rhusiopathiae]
MKFDVVVGNPPYQENDNGQRDDGSVNASASPLYHFFVESSEKISSIQSLIIPARWISGAGKGLGKFSDKMISENKIKHFCYYPDSKSVFPSNDIKGGVCHFIKENVYNGKAIIEVLIDESIETSFRYLDENKIGIFIPYKKLLDILSKVINKEDIINNNLQNIVSVLKPYGLRTDLFRNTGKYGLPNVQDIKLKDNDIEIIGLEQGKRVIKFVPQDYPFPTGQNLVRSYKVFLSYAYGSGEFGEAASEPIVGKPNQICTETFLSIGDFNSFEEAINLTKYIKTKFLRSLVSILKTTQHSTRTYKFVPLQDFTSTSDIDWKQSVADVDKQLYKKYGLTQEEIDFIETKVKEME